MLHLVRINHLPDALNPPPNSGHSVSAIARSGIFIFMENKSILIIAAMLKQGLIVILSGKMI